MKFIKKSFDGKNREENEFGDHVYRDCVLLNEGFYTDSYSKTKVFYDGSIIKEYAKNWTSNFLTMNHENGILSRIGFVENPHWEDEKLLADLRIIPVTNNARDVISLIENDLVKNLSIEAKTEEEWDNNLRCLRLNYIEFLGTSLVTVGACNDAHLNTNSRDDLN